MTLSTLPDLTIVLPTTWRRRSDPDRGVVVAARSVLLPGSGIRPDLTLRAGPVTEPDAVRWRAQALAELSEALDELAVEDDDRFDLDGYDVLYHRFAHRVGTVDVVCEQWSWLVDGYGVTLTCSAAREDHLDYSDLFEAVAASVELAPKAA
ncbi:hypothetical protein [Nocardioides sp. GXZ039]|uniref:hypothetical protein n=1 Tax=Nocardioides sp. GXZ039 TaxID=3136018 RepID=UPI0030F3CB6E